MTRTQRILIGVMVCLVIAVLVAVMIAFLSLVRQSRAAQVADLPTDTPFPTVIFPATYTPTPKSDTPIPVLANSSNPNAVSAAPRATIDPNNPAAVASDLRPLCAFGLPFALTPTRGCPIYPRRPNSRSNIATFI